MTVMSALKEQIYKTKLAKPELFEEFSKKGVTSVFIYSRAILKNGNIYYYDDSDRGVRAVMRNGETYVPADFFSRFLGLSIKEDEGEISVSSETSVLSAKIGGKRYLLNGTKGEFTYPVTRSNGKVYLPALKVALALGVSGRGYDDGKLTVFAETAILDEIETNEELQISASYATLGRYDASKFSKEDFEAVKSKWRLSLVGSPEMNDRSDPDMREKLDALASDAKRLLDSMNKGKDRFILFGNEEPVESAELTTQYSKLWTMTMGFATYGSPLYGNEELKNAILDGLQWMYENMYGEAEIEGRGWRDMKIFNWWDWFFGGIQPLTNILMVMEEHLTYEQIKTYLKCFLYVLTIHRLGYHRPCAMSRLTVCTKAALLLEDREMLENECADYDLTLQVTRTEEGIHVDYVEWTHGYPYNMMYGFNNLSRTAIVGTLMGGTAMEFVSPKQYELYKVAKYMFEAACYKGQGFMIYNGRGNAGTEFSSGVSIMVGVLPLIGLFGEEEDMHLKKLIKRCASTPRLVDMLKKSCSVYQFAKLMDILRDESISATNDYELCHAWYTGDRLVQHRNDYALLVAMPSSRHPSYESINSANKRGWYTGDGALYLYTDHDRNVYDGANYITKESVCYRVAGTTVDDRKRQVWSYRKGWKPSTDYSGCIDVREKFGMAAFDYESYNYSGHESDGSTDDGYGGGFTYYENDLRAKKSYFFFDKECVCLGAGIDSTMDSNVLTTIEHRRLLNGNEAVYVDGKRMADSDYEVMSQNAKWMYLDGAAGYVLLQNAEIRIRRYLASTEQSAKDNYFVPDKTSNASGDPFFEINIYHGKNPSDASYQYVLLPCASPDSTAEYAASPEIEIISNTRTIQAVRKASLGITCMAFYEAGSCLGVTVDSPCLVILSEENGILTVSVSEPTHKVNAVRLTLDKEYELLNAPITVKVSAKSGNTVLDINTDYATGEPRRVSFKL